MVDLLVDLFRTHAQRFLSGGILNAFSTGCYRKSTENFLQLNLNIKEPCCVWVVTAQGPRGRVSIQTL